MSVSSLVGIKISPRVFPAFIQVLMVNVEHISVCGGIVSRLPWPLLNVIVSEGEVLVTG